MANKTREQLINELRISQQEVSQLLVKMGDVQDWQREPVEWSFRYLAAHLANVERECHFVRIVGIASGENPNFSSYIESGIDFMDHDLADSLTVWADLRTELLDFVVALPDEALIYTGVYPVIGQITLLEALDDLYAQDEGHARHIRQLIVDFEEHIADGQC